MRANTGQTVRLWLLLAVAVVVTGGLAWGVVSAFGADATPSPAEKTVLHVGWTAEPDNLNPFVGYETSALEIFHLNYMFLVGFRSKDLSPAPELAAELPTVENGGISDGGKVWTFQIRPNITWQDGEPCTAEDVKFTFDYIMENQLGMYTSYCDLIKKVEVIDPLTVRFVCSKPKANMLGLVLFVVPKHVWSKVPGKEAGTSFQNDPPIIGNGPFQCVEWKRGQYVRMVANEDYWRGAPKVDEIVFSLYENADTMAADLQAGNLQVAWDIPQAQFDKLDADPDLRAIGGALNGFTHMGFNCYAGKHSKGHPVLRDWRFRQALNWAIDKDEIIASAYMGHARPATSIIASDYYGDERDIHWEPPADEVYTYDPAKAEAALDAGGYRDADGDGIREYRGKPISLRIYARSQSVTDQRVGKLIAGWLKKVGLDIRYEMLDENAMNDRIYTFTDDGRYAPDYDLFLWYWYSDPDPNFIFSVLTSDQIGWWSDTGWADYGYDKLYYQQQTTVDPEARKEILWKMQEIVYQQSPYITLTYPEWLEAYNDAQWTGWVQSPEKIGPVIYTEYNIDSYLFVEPVSAAGKEASSSTTLIVIIVVLAAVVIVTVMILWARGRRRAEEV